MNEYGGSGNTDHFVSLKELLAPEYSAQLENYNPGLINDFGGGNINWWMDYIRSEVDQCNDHWREIIESGNVIPEGCVLVPVDLIEAVAHIGVDFGFGEYCLEEHHIAKAREIFAMLKAAEVCDA